MDQASLFKSFKIAILIIANIDKIIIPKIKTTGITVIKELIF